VLSERSTTKVGRSSCSNNSIIPIEFRGWPAFGPKLFELCIPSPSELLLPAVELLSKLPRVMLFGVEPEKKLPCAGAVTVPRAKLTVLTWDSSSRALLSILAAASELEKRVGSSGRWRRVLLKKSGLEGSNAEPLNVRASRLYLNRGLTRGRLVGWSVDATGVLTSEGRLFLVLVKPPVSKGRDRSKLVVFVVMSRGAQVKLPDRFFDSAAGMARC
jgi:hypothetical protein